MIEYITTAEKEDGTEEITLVTDAKTLNTLLSLLRRELDTKVKTRPSSLTKHQHSDEVIELLELKYDIETVLMDSEGI
jgi:hypothetical protein